MNALEMVAFIARSRRRSSGLDMDTLLPIIIGVVVVVVIVAIVVMLMKKKKESGNAGVDPNSAYGGYDYSAQQPYAQPYDSLGAQGYATPDYSNPMQNYSNPVQNYANPVQDYSNPVQDSLGFPQQTATPVDNTVNPVAPATPVAPANDATELVIDNAPSAEPKTYVKLVNVQTGATYEAELGEQLTIGKRDCGITISDDNSISGTHCQIYTYEDKYVLADAQSTNGTKLNDYKIETPVFIENGAILGIGKQKFTVTFEEK